MSIKLSELLEEAVLSMLDVSEEANENEQHKLSERYTQQAKALRAIVPALLAAMKDAVGRHIEIEDHNALCSACRLQRILSEAGVTCE